MRHTIMFNSTVRCSDGEGGKVAGVVVDPHTSRLEYVIVHRGLLRGHDFCVPCGDISAVSESELILWITVDQLKALPELEAQVPGQTYKQRSIPERDVVLRSATILKGQDGSTLGTAHGAVVDSDNIVQGVVWSKDHRRVYRPERWDEDQLTIAAAGEPYAEPVAPPPVVHSGMPVDPVCDRQVDPAIALKTTYHDQLYYFCSGECRQAFETAPDQYVSKQRSVAV